MITRMQRFTLIPNYYDVGHGGRHRRSLVLMSTRACMEFNGWIQSLMRFANLRTTAHPLAAGCTPALIFYWPRILPTQYSLRRLPSLLRALPKPLVLSRLDAFY
jgi:hypothetical protein